MRRSVLLIPFLATAAMGQWSDGNAPIDLATLASGDVPVIVEFRDPPLVLRAAASAKAVIPEYQAAFRRFRSDVRTYSNIRYEYYELFNGIALTVPASGIDGIRQLPYVKAVHLDLAVHALSATPSANITKIRADQVWSTLGTRGKGIVVAIIDTGVDYTHPALGGGIGPGFKVIGGYDFVNKDTDPMDDNMHGTHVAGIIAGDSDTIVGVAPEVSLLAYKVLSSQGSGRTSDVIAGIERAADPNGDGDFSDHADIANLSLGGLGNPDDASSTAIDNGTAAGVVFCVAAGNSGAFHTIGSPGCARSAITVGASDNNDAIASFSSRGPNSKNAAIKPDLVAPGVSILSSVLKGKYASLSGTSMATPHVAGVAALVKSLHRDWTAEQIKSAIVNSAQVLAQEIMVQGGGRVDALGAATATFSVVPSSISLGEDHLPLTTWSPFATLHITNNGSRRATYTVNALSSTGLTITASPSQVDLSPGSSSDVKISYSMTNSEISPGASLGFGGEITIISSAMPATAHVPWAAVKGARVLLAYDKPLPSVSFVERTAGLIASATAIDGATLEAFLRAGTYDMLLTWSQIDLSSLAPGASFRLSDLRVHYLEGQSIADDTSLAVNSSQASHTITFDGRNENGQPLVGSDFNGYGSTGRIVYPPGGTLQSLVLSAYATRAWHITDIAPKVLLEELNFSRSDSHFYIVPYPALNGVHDDVTLTAGGSALKRVSASLTLSPPAAGDQRVVLYVRPITPPGDASGLLGLVLRPTANYFNTTLFIGPDGDADYSVGVVISSITDASTRFTTPPLRILNGKLMASTSSQPPSWAYDGDGLIFGSGLLYPRQTFTAGSTPLKPNLFTDFVGQLGEVRVGDRASTTTTIYASDSSVQSTGSKYPMPLDLSQAGAFTITAVNSGVLTQGVPRKSTVTTTVDSSRPDFYPPTFNALMLFDANGQIASHLTPHQAGWLLFAAADYAYSASGSRTYQPIAADQTKVWFRYSGTQQWQPLTATQVTEDSALGILFRVDLTRVANVDNLLVDLKFDIADGSGNMTTFVIEPAFAVGRDSWFGRRGPHR